MMNEENRLLTAKQVSGYLGIPLRTVHRLSKKGKLGAFKVGGQWRYLRKDIRSYGVYFASDGKKDFLTSKEVSEYLHIHLRTVHRLSKQGKIKSFKIGGRWRYLRKDIERYDINGIDFSREPARKALSEVEPHSGVIEQSDRRLYPRINTNFASGYSIKLPPFKEIQNEGIIKNLSGGGAFLVGKSDAIDIGDPIELRFVLEKRGDIYTRGKVVRKEKNGVGIKFKDIDREVRERIIEYAG